MLPREHYLKQTYQDGVNFPNGFEKGGLSDIQARLIRKHGALINALTIDEVSDPTTEDLHILKVIANQSAPKSPVEQAWIKYLNLVKANQTNSPKANKSKTAKSTKAAADKTEPTEAEPKLTKADDKADKPAKAEPKAAKPKKTTKTEAG
jgi:uncharacterized protein YifE (UPF0438 family)